MAVPAGYTIALTINTLGVVGNVLGVNTTLYQCPTCRATTLDPNAHDAWHTANAAAIKSAADAVSAAAKTASNVDFPEDFNPTTQDMAQVDPPMRVANQG